MFSTGSVSICCLQSSAQCTSLLFMWINSILTRNWKFCCTVFQKHFGNIKCCCALSSKKLSLFHTVGPCYIRVCISLILNIDFINQYLHLIVSNFFGVTIRTAIKNKFNCLVLFCQYFFICNLRSIIMQLLLFPLIAEFYWLTQNLENIWYQKIHNQLLLQNAQEAVLIGWTYWGHFTTKPFLRV